MFAAHDSQPLLEPNVLYFDIEPPKNVKKNSSPIKRRHLKRNCSGVKGQESVIQKEIAITDNMETNDPLFMPQTELKAAENNEEGEISEHDDKKFSRRRKENVPNELLNKADVELDEDDEPLISWKKITETHKSRKRKDKAFRLRNCLDTCRFKCSTKFLKCQRVDINEYYKQLNKEERLNFIRQHMRKPILTRIRNKKRGTNCCYFLKYYKIGSDLLVKPIPAEKEEVGDCNNDNLTKVCRKFFEGTLGISHPEIKKALEGFELRYERTVKPLREIKKEQKINESGKSLEKSVKTSQQFLDPETGDLTNTKPKTKTKRRKRGEPPPEHFPKPINCALHCTFKCHENFTEKERKQICDMFWSLDFKRRKDFILARLEAKDVATPTVAEFRKSNRVFRKYQSRFFIRSGLHGENKRVCKHFIMRTLCINHNFIENAIRFADKTTGNYTGVDGRGRHEVPAHKLSAERKQTVYDHINSYPVWTPNKKSKLRCLHQSLSIKRIYKDYRQQCFDLQKKPVSRDFYYKVFQKQFRLLFLSNVGSKKARGFVAKNSAISQYTGDEPGGCWLDSKNNELDLNLFNLNESLNYLSLRQLATKSYSSRESNSSELNFPNTSTDRGTTGFNLSQPLNYSTAAHHLDHFMTDSTNAETSSQNLRAILPASVQEMHDNDNLTYTGSVPSIFRLV